MIQTTKQEKLGTLLALVFKLQDETSFPDQKQRQEALNKLTDYAQQIGLNLDPNDPEFLPTLLIKILEESSKPTELPQGNLPPQELTEIYERDRAKREAELQKAMASTKDYGDYRSYIDLYKKWISKNKPELPNQLIEAIAEKSAQRAITSLEAIAQPNVLAKEEKEKIFQQAETIVKEELKKVELEEVVVQEAEKIVKAEDQKIQKEQEKIVEEFKKTLTDQSVKIAANPQIIRPIKETRKVDTIPDQKISLPDTIIGKLEQPPQEINFLPLYTILHPPTLIAWVEKKIYTIPAKLLKIGTEEATPEWQAMAQAGLFTETYPNTIRILKDWGLPTDHPIIKKLEDKSERLKEQQKILREIKKGTSLTQIWQDKLATKILKRYHHFNEITNRKKNYDPDLKSNHPLNPIQGDWANFLRNTFDRFRFINKNYEKFSKFITRGKYNSVFTPVRKFVSQKIVQPAVQWLAKTAVGQAVKAGVKKAATWLATRLGVELAATAAGTAAGGVPGVIILIVSIAIEVLIFIGKKIIRLIQKITRDPEKSLIPIVFGVLALSFIGGPLRLIGIVPIIIGVGGLIKFTLNPATLGGAGAGISGFFTTLSGAASTFPITAVLISIFGGIIGLTLFIVLVVSGAFILPSKVAEVTPTTISPYESKYFSISKNAKPGKIDNSQIKNTTIEYTVTIKSKGSSLRINSIKENMSVFNKDGQSLSIIPYSFEKELKEKNEIEPNETWEITYFFNLQTSFQDPSILSNSIILNTINVSIVVDDKETHPGVASVMVIIGEPPISCFVLDDTLESWTLEKRVIILKVISSETQAHPIFFTKICSRGPIKLKTGYGNGSFNGLNPYPGGTITLYDRAFNRESGLTYTFIHELGHELDYITQGSLLADFVDKVLCQTGENQVNCEGLTPWYRWGITPAEDFAETIATYSFGPNYRNFLRDYPLHYNYAKNVIFKE